MEKIIQSIVLGLLFVFSTSVSGQEETIIKPGLISGQATISPSKMLGFNESRFYLHGNLEAYLNDKVSLAGEIYFDLGSLTEGQNSFQFNHKLFFGASWHFTHNNNDLYIGIQPGVSATKLNLITTLPAGAGATTGINPIFSSVLGYNYFVNKFFHFFVQSRITLGEHNYDAHTNLAEFNFSAGLGFNINAKQK